MSLHFTIPLRSRNYALPPLLKGIYAAGFALWFGLLGVCGSIFLYACASVALGG